MYNMIISYKKLNFGEKVLCGQPETTQRYKKLSILICYFGFDVSGNS